MKKYLKGFANLGFFEVLTNTLSAYACGTDRATLIGASSCSPTDNKTDFSIPADDGIYDSGSDWTDTTLVITVLEADLANLAQLIGAEFDTELKEGTFDEPNEVALTFSALRRDGGYRLYRYFCCKCTGYKVTHNTRVQITMHSPMNLHSSVHRERLTILSAQQRTSTKVKLLHTLIQWRMHNVLQKRQKHTYEYSEVL